MQIVSWIIYIVMTSLFFVFQFNQYDGGSKVAIVVVCGALSLVASLATESSPRSTRSLLLAPYSTLPGILCSYHHSFSYRLKCYHERYS